MRTITKKRFIIISAFLAGLMFIVGLFLVPREKKKTGFAVDVAAASSTDASKIYFEEGAQMLLTKDEISNNVLRFTLNIDDSLISSNYILVVSFADESITNWGTSELYNSNNKIVNVYEDSNSAFSSENGVWYLNLSALTVDTDSESETYGFATLYVKFETRTPVTDVQVKARVFQGEDYKDETAIVYTATSDTWSVMKSWLGCVNNPDDYGGLMTESRFPWIFENVRNYYNPEFATGEYVRTSTQMDLSENNGLTILVSIKDEMIELLKNGRATNHRSSFKMGITNERLYTMEEYYLVLTRSPNLSDYEGKIALPSGEGVANHVFSLDSTNGQIQTATCLENAFLEENSEYITIDIPTDTTMEYYYYATVVKSVKWKLSTTYMFGAFENTLYGVTSEDLPWAWKLPSDIPQPGQTVVYSSSTYYNKSIETLANELLSRGSYMSDNKKKILQTLAGTYTDTTFTPVRVVYKTMGDTGPIETSKTFNVLSLYKHEYAFVRWALFQSGIATHEWDFNVVQTGHYYDENGYTRETGKRVILQADGLEYVYDKNTDTGTLTVVYDEFKEKDFALTIVNNDDANELRLPYYVSDMTSENGYTTLRFTYNTIKKHLGNSVGWLFDLTADSFSVLGQPSTFTVDKGADALTITYPSAESASLATLNVVAVADIKEDVEYDVSVEYRQLTDESGTINVQTETVSLGSMWYRWIQTITLEILSDVEVENGDGTTTTIGTLIEEGVTIDTYDGLFYEPLSVEYLKNETEKTCIINVTYNERVAFQVTNSLDDSYFWLIPDGSSLTFAGREFISEAGVPAGYRVKGMTVDSNDLLVKLDMDNPDDFTSDTSTMNITLMASLTESEIYNVRVVYTDTYDLVITYKETIVSSVTGQKTPFAVEKTSKKTVKVADYQSEFESKTISSEKIAKILNVAELTVGITPSGGGMVQANGLQAIVFDGVSTYSINVEYGVVTVRNPSFTDYPSGAEIQVPLSNYADWCESFGANWTLLYLNGSKIQYFKYSNDQGLEPKNVYGFFSMMVFEEKVTKIQDWFSKETSGGLSALFNQKTVAGSALYKFSESFGWLLGGIYMTCEEFLNSDAKTYYTHFFYVDGSTENGYAYASNYGADNAFDNDTGFENALQDVGGGIGRFFKGIGDWIGDFFGGWDIIKKILSVVLFVSLGIIIVAFIIWLLRKTGIIPEKGAVKKTSAPRKKKTTSKSKSKKGKKK